MLKYNYALDNQGNIINIIDVDEEGHLKREFFCISCGASMVAAIGKKRRYFRHKVEINCNLESYLHKLSKIRIKQRFDDFTKPFEIQLYGKMECGIHCRFFEDRRCTFSDYHLPIDLHKYYDTCNIEKGIDGYIADLLLTHSKDPNREPILLEVRVKHKCSEEKINSGKKIIEISIDSEEDIEQLFLKPWNDRENSLEKKERYSFYNFNPRPEKLNIKNYTYKNEIALRIPRFILYPSGKYIVDIVKCYEHTEPTPKKSLLQFNIYKSSVSEISIAHYLKRKYRIELKACSICRHAWWNRYSERHCNIKDKYPYVLMKHIPEFSALECSHFELKWLSKIEAEEQIEETDIEIIIPYKQN